jgi:flavodoxin I
MNRRLVNIIVLLVFRMSSAFVIHTTVIKRREHTTSTSVGMAAVGIFYGTSTGNTQACAEKIFEAFGPDLAAEPIDVDTLEEGQVAKVFAEHGALIVGTPTWNTGADTERSGTGWDEIYYSKLPALKSALKGKKVAVFGLGDQVSYSENYADAAGELFDVFEELGCEMLGSWSQEGYEHENSKSIRGDKFCGLLLDMINQEDLTEERVQSWVKQLKDEGILDNTGLVNGAPSEVISIEVDESKEAIEPETVEQGQQSSGSPATVGFTPHYNAVKGKTMWTSPDGTKSFFT